MNKLTVTSGKREDGRGNTEVGDQAVQTIRYNPEEEELKAGNCLPVFRAALFTTAQWWKQAKCPRAGEWTNKTWHIQTMEYDSAFKKEF